MALSNWHLVHGTGYLVLDTWWRVLDNGLRYLVSPVVALFYFQHPDIIQQAILSIRDMSAHFRPNFRKRLDSNPLQTAEAPDVWKHLEIFGKQLGLRFLERISEDLHIWIINEDCSVWHSSSSPIDCLFNNIPCLPDLHGSIQPITAWNVFIHRRPHQRRQGVLITFAYITVQNLLWIQHARYRIGTEWWF